METHQGERECFSPLSQSHLPLSSGVIHLDIILIDEGSLYMIPTTSSARKKPRKQQWEWALAPCMRIAQLSFPCHRKPGWGENLSFVSRGGFTRGDPSHHCIFTDEMGKGRMQGWRSGQLLKCNWCNDSVLQNETLSHLFQVIPPIPPRGEGTGLPCRAAGGHSPPLPAHLPGSSPGEFPGQVPANASAPAGDQHVLLGQVSQLGWQHQAHGSFHHQIHHLHREQQQGAQPLPDHPLLPGKVLFQTSTKPRWQRTKSNTLHAPPDGWQVFNPLPKLGGKRFLNWKNPSLPLKKMKVGVK